MLRRMVARMKIVTLAGLGLLLVAGAAHAQQGWPIVGSNWDTTGGSSRGSFSSSYSGEYSAPSYASPASPSYAAFPSTVGSYYAVSPFSVGSTSAYSYAAPSSEGYYSDSTASSSGKRSIRVNLSVPGDAKVWFDGSPTSQTGAARSFESPPVAVGQEYAYQIRVQWKQNGKDVTQTRQVAVHAGDVINLSLGSSGVAMTQ